MAGKLLCAEHQRMPGRSYARSETELNLPVGKTPQLARCLGRIRGAGGLEERCEHWQALFIKVLFARKKVLFLPYSDCFFFSLCFFSSFSFFLFRFLFFCSFLFFSFLLTFFLPFFLSSSSFFFFKQGECCGTICPQRKVNGPRETTTTSTTATTIA